DRRGERPFDRDKMLLDSFERRIRKPLACSVIGFLSSQYLFPFDLPFTVVCLAYGSIKDLAGGFPDIHANAIALNIWDDRIVGNIEFSGPSKDNGSRIHGFSFL